MQDDPVECDTLRGFSRPRYFHGQLLGVHHFESALAYAKRKQWLHNRLVDGYGVVCGLDLRLGDDGNSVIVMPGLALDRRGREIVVPDPSRPMPLPPREPNGDARAGDGRGAGEGGHCDDEWMHVVICYDECATAPEPVMAGECGHAARCSPGAIREGYALSLRPGEAPRIPVDPAIERCIKASGIDYRALVDWVSAPCECDSGDPCIVLANIRLQDEEPAVEIDIAVRPIVYSADLLWEILLALGQDTPGRRGGKSPREAI